MIEASRLLESARPQRITCAIVLLSIAFLACDTSGVEGVRDSAPSRAAAEVPAANLDPAASGAAVVVLLGTGTPVPDLQRSGPATAVVVGTRAYLVDAGAGVVRRALEAQSMGIPALDPRNLDRAFITHLHSDHTVGLPDLMLTPAVIGRTRPLQLFGPPGLQAMRDDLLAAYQGDLAIRHAGKSAAQLTGYQVEVHETEGGELLRQDGVVISAFAASHGDFEHALGFRFEAGGRVIVISGDTAPSEELVRACNGCDVLVHEVFCEASVRRGSPAIQDYHGRFHTSSRKLAELASRARPRLLVLSHVLLFGCSEAQLLAEVREGYAGEVVVGRDLDVY